MASPVPPREIVLMPGELFFGRGDGVVSTLLGSCVAVVFWHPLQCIGAMCHFLLPTGIASRAHRPGMYADMAIPELARQAATAGTRAADYRVHVAGGGHMFPDLPKDPGGDIGCRNVQAARGLLAEHGFLTAVEDVGGEGHRRVHLDLRTGAVTVHFTACADDPGARRRSACAAQPAGARTVSRTT